MNLSQSFAPCATFDRRKAFVRVCPSGISLSEAMNWHVSAFFEVLPIILSVNLMISLTGILFLLHSRAVNMHWTSTVFNE